MIASRLEAGVVGVWAFTREDVTILGTGGINPPLALVGMVCCEVEYADLLESTNGGLMAVGPLSRGVI